MSGPSNRASDPNNTCSKDSSTHNSVGEEKITEAERTLSLLYQRASEADKLRTELVELSSSNTKLQNAFDKADSELTQVRFIFPFSLERSGRLHRLNPPLFPLSLLLWDFLDRLRTSFELVCVCRCLCVSLHLQLRVLALSHSRFGNDATRHTRQRIKMLVYTFVRACGVCTCSHAKVYVQVREQSDKALQTRTTAEDDQKSLHEEVQTYTHQVTRTRANTHHHT